MDHIRPLKRNGHDVYSRTHQTNCPYCNTQSTLDEEDIGWVPGPVLSRWYICLGCCEDIYSVCASDEYDTHNYREIVEEAAKVEGISPLEFRIKCIEQQIEAGQDRLKYSSNKDIQRRLHRLMSLLDKLKKTSGY